VSLQIWHNLNLPIRVSWSVAQDAQMPSDWLPVPIPNANPFPKLWGNVNLFPRAIYQDSEVVGIGDAWRKFIELEAVPPVTLAPTGASPAIGGGAASFTVTITGYGVSGTWFWDKDASATWLTVTSPLTPQTASGPLNYTVAANAGAPRSANIYVNGKTFTVSQAGV
jgi:hypothetical protein